MKRENQTTHKDAVNFWDICDSSDSAENITSVGNTASAETIASDLILEPATFDESPELYAEAYVEETDYNSESGSDSEEEFALGVLNAGYSALKNGKFDAARRKFFELQIYEQDLLHRNKEESKYPDMYWGIVLANASCKSDEELATKKSISNASLSKNEYCLLYQASLENLRKKGVPQVSRYEKQMNLRCAQMELRSRAHLKMSKVLYGIGFALLLAAGIAGSVIFYSYDISSSWFGVLNSNLSMVIGVPCAILAIIGAIIGFFFLVSEGDESALGGVIGGAIGGAIAGLVIAALIFACCWALAPIAAALLLGGFGFLAYIRAWGK